MAGTVKVTNNATYLNQPKTILAKVGGHSHTIAHNGTYTFQDVEEGKQNFTVQVEPAVTGLSTGHQTVNISSDFNNFAFRISLEGHEWKMQKVAQ